ncbi:MAG: pyridoxamine 5'-phosphate oxidase family protein [Eubacteriales bacterium]|nr:pyridoxamine 5'-phosphate oxidase family protein [Eubacteriales bacterium]
MRRKDREVTDPVLMEAIIADCDCCRLGICDADSVYIVPFNFAYTPGPDGGAFYFHCAKEGRKLDLIAQNAHVGFELDTHHRLISAQKVCGFTFLYASVIGKGVIIAITGVTEKKEALLRIVEKYSGSGEWSFSDEEAETVAILRLDVTEMTAKQHL